MTTRKGLGFLDVKADCKFPERVFKTHKKTQKGSYRIIPDSNSAVKPNPVFAGVLPDAGF